MTESDSSSDSDNDYLTNRRSQKGSYNREALVRKKLLENFYGKNVHTSDEQTDESSLEDENPNTQGATTKGKDDVDSVNFDARSYTSHQIRELSVADLLETEDTLSLQVRTLDSTMQTLVYENYSRFIDATEAIRSIGVNVQSNEKGLRRLAESMESIDNRSKEMEATLGCLRDHVAEKLRIKRLLTRLDALLKLPQTLRNQIKLGKYRTATKSYLAASSILQKHSQGFESLKNIEDECTEILSNLRQTLKLKLLHWSGRITPMDDEGVDTGEFDSENSERKFDGNSFDPPKTMTEIFECAGTLFMLREVETELSKTVAAETIQAELSTDDFQSMAVSAAMRLLDRQLDSHLIQVQETRASKSGYDTGMSRSEKVEDSLPGSSLVPDDFLDSVLEGASLYGMSFGAESVGKGHDYLMEFVNEALSSFFSHIRAILYEECIAANRVSEDLEENGQAVSYKEVSGALVLLVQRIKELASGLTLPDIGIDSEYASSVVNQMLHLTETMVHRRVDRKFQDLRLSVIQHCLVPLVEHMVTERLAAIKEEKAVITQILQIATNSLSDVLQLVDDEIRSIFSGGLADSSGDLKDAVLSSAYSFAFWLANAFEMLAGGDSADPNLNLEAPLLQAVETKENTRKTEKVATIYSKFDQEFLDADGQASTLINLIESTRSKLLDDQDLSTTVSVHPDFILTIAELCRFSQISVPDNLEQSVAVHSGSRKRSRGLFPDEINALNPVQHNRGSIAERFELAASRVLVIFATNAGCDGGQILCGSLITVGRRSQNEMPVSPSTDALLFLQFAKTTSLQCFSVMGGSKAAGPVPEFERNSYSFRQSGIGRKTGLHLDVERMFKQKLSIYPHPSEVLLFSRNAVLFVFFRIAFRELVENSRWSRYSIGGFAQLFVDIEFIKHMVPHYLSSDYSEKGNNACIALSSLLSDAIETIEDRVSDARDIDLDDIKRDSFDIIASFLEEKKEGNFGDDFMISSD